MALLLLTLPPLTAIASAQDAVPALSRQLGQAESDLDAVDGALDGRVQRDDLPALRSKALAAQSAASDAVAALTAQLALVDARITGLGPVTPGVQEAADIRTQRAQLARERAALDSAAKRGRLMVVEAEQLSTEIDQSQAQQISEQIATRTASPLSPVFWGELVRSLPRDMRRASHFVRAETRQVDAGLRAGPPWAALIGAVLALTLLFPARLVLRRAGQRFLIEGAPGHRLRRSAYALWRLLTGTAAPLLAALAFVQGLRWSDLIAPAWEGVADALVLGAGIGGFIGAVGGALLMRNQSSWRITPITDEAAQQLRPLTWMLAGLALFSILLDAVSRAAGASSVALGAGQAIKAVLHLLLIGSALLRIGYLRSRRADEQDDVAAVRAGIAALTVGLWLLVAVAAAALLIGYVGFSLLIGQMIAWILLLSASLYLLMTAGDDVATSIFVRDSRVGQTLSKGLGLRGSAIDQFGVLLSGALRLALALLALGMMLSPFGSGIGSLFERLGALGQGIEVGGIAISPGAILRFMVVLALGLTLVRLFMRWLDQRYLPTTDLDGSGRNSISLVARYVGIALAGIWALASLGIGVERIALLLSALSVGIGFGLQAITQNFVSGLILLAERPIKIGDLVRVGTDEGDVKRISVRSTEIELADHSTLIVPNSELITKSVLNKTLAGPLGRIQIQFSVPIDSDADQVRGIVLDAFAAEPAVLETPAPSAFVDSIVDGRTQFNCFAHVATPRAAYSARSNVLMALLRDFRGHGIDLGTVAQRMELVAATESLTAAPARAEGAAGPP
ncbi:DUF3772 domain-containing protein [uncultured Sphingomonas sp.]|uniref:DUF3772 domain-containing protein n=1 Tax=uncultured Sphingomonas sp. TaxID=158754 RepID=UPI0025F7DEDA|nr:DUF3772 domain-containing protein [uncultured Sphingomonas sp.]